MTKTTAGSDDQTLSFLLHGAWRYSTFVLLNEHTHKKKYVQSEPEVTAHAC